MNHTEAVRNSRIKQIKQLIREGLTANEIASAINCSFSTIAKARKQIVFSQTHTEISVVELMSFYRLLTKKSIRADKNSLIKKIIDELKKLI
jgi:IS30 family transposase